MRNKKVLMVGNHLSLKGGMTTVISQILNHNWVIDGITIKFIPSYIPSNIFIKTIYFLRAYIRVFVELIFSKPDIVHLHMSYKGSFYRNNALRKLCKAFKIPVIVHLHGSEFEKWYNLSNSRTQIRIRQMLHDTFAFIVLGNKWNTIIKKIEPESNTVIIKNTVAEQKKSCRWNDECFQIIYLGVLIKRKGVMDLIQAFEKLVEQDTRNKIRLVIAGTGDEELILKNKVDDLNLGNRVSFCGWVVGDKKLELLEKSQLLVLPSYNEGLPVSILEAISFGLPVIATDVGDISLAVHDSINGYLVEPGNVNAMASAMSNLLHDRGKWEKYSTESLKLAKTEFSERDFFERLKSVYLS